MTRKKSRVYTFNTRNNIELSIRITNNLMDDDNPVEAS